MHILASHAAVHPDPDPVEAPPPAPAPAQGQGQWENAAVAVLLMADSHEDQLVFRICQVYFAAFAMAFSHDFASITAFRYLLSAAALQFLWSLAVAIVDVYALHVGRSFRTFPALGIFTIGDWITGALTFNAACASAGITVLIGKHPEFCPRNPCPSFVTTTGLAFVSWFLLAPCCVQNLATVVYKLQRP